MSEDVRTGRVRGCRYYAKNDYLGMISWCGQPWALWAVKYLSFQCNPRQKIKDFMVCCSCCCHCRQGRRAHRSLQPSVSCCSAWPSTGSMCSVTKPSPTDSLRPDLVLESADGSNMPCYGTKDISLRLGRKEYHIKTVISRVREPLP